MKEYWYSNGATVIISYAKFSSVLRLFTIQVCNVYFHVVGLANNYQFPKDSRYRWAARWSYVTRNDLFTAG
jgi:hypothetical protein